ncbi:MAG: hypothetical protein NTU57_05155 [Candidatus Aenigmarchaeota archaeon]|nr:hypothetical protein [Candidatus Aenigmarchaeota archaeon]
MKKTKTIPIADENKKIQPKGKEKGMERMNMWKVVALVFLALFGLAVTGGLFRIYTTHAGPPMNVPTQEQMDSARNVVAQELAKSGDNISNYEVTVSSMIMKLDRTPPMFNMMEGPEDQRFDENMSLGNTIHVSLESDTKTHFYLVSIDSGKIIMHSFTEWTGNG